ncbi:hypothetical protein LguiA_011407 [Lonicera macranthoides]
MLESYAKTIGSSVKIDPSTLKRPFCLYARVEVQEVPAKAIAPKDLNPKDPKPKSIPKKTQKYVPKVQQKENSTVNPVTTEQPSNTINSGVEFQVENNNVQATDVNADAQLEAAISNNSNLKVYMSKAKQKRMKKAAIEQANKRNISITKFNNPPDEDFTECEFRQLEEASEREAAEAAGVAFIVCYISHFFIGFLCIGIALWTASFGS